MLDYRVSVAIYPDGDYSVFSDSVTDDYVTVTGLIFGTTYKFFVESRNLVGYSV